MKIKRFNCYVPSCKKTFRSEENLMSHLTFHRNQQEVEEQICLFECEICSKKFATKRSVSAHKRVHNLDKEFHMPYKLAKVFCHQLSMCLRNDYSQEKVVFEEQGLNLPKISCPKFAVLPLFESVFQLTDRKEF